MTRPIFIDNAIGIISGRLSGDRVEVLLESASGLPASVPEGEHISGTILYRKVRGGELNEAGDGIAEGVYLEWRERVRVTGILGLTLMLERDISGQRPPGGEWFAASSLSRDDGGSVRLVIVFAPRGSDLDIARGEVRFDLNPKGESEVSLGSSEKPYKRVSAREIDLRSGETGSSLKREGEAGRLFDGEDKVLYRRDLTTEERSPDVVEDDGPLALVVSVGAGSFSVGSVELPSENYPLYGGFRGALVYPQITGTEILMVSSLPQAIGKALRLTIEEVAAVGSLSEGEEMTIDLGSGTRVIPDTGEVFVSWSSVLIYRVGGGIWARLPAFEQTIVEWREYLRRVLITVGAGVRYGGDILSGSVLTGSVGADYMSLRGELSIGGRQINRVYSVARAPTETDDETANVRVGDIWRFGAVLYVCTDATEGAAVWDSIARKGTVELWSGNQATAQSGVQIADGHNFSDFTWLYVCGFERVNYINVAGLVVSFINDGCGISAIEPRADSSTSIYYVNETTFDFRVVPDAENRPSIQKIYGVY